MVLLSSVLFVRTSEKTIALTPQEKPLQVWFFDVGQGDAIFLESPTGEQMLVDGGPNAQVVAKLGSVMLPTDRTIDYVVLTHPDADHVNGLPAVFDGYEIHTYIHNGEEKGTQAVQALQERVQIENSSVRVASAGDAFSLGNVEITVLSPIKEVGGDASSNARSIVLLVAYGETSVLLTGDAEAEVEEKFAPSAGDVDVLKVGHHGSRFSTSMTLLEATTPQDAVISVGAENRYGHPYPIVLDHLSTRGVHIFRTDLDGDILLQSFGGEPILRPNPLPF